MLSGLSYSRSINTLNAAQQHKQDLLDRIFGVNALAAVGAPPNASPLKAIPAGSTILGVGFGAKATVGAIVQGQIAVRVYVRAKMPESQVPESERIPSDINGIPTDVITVGDITHQAVSCGVSVGHIKITAGTLGCLVEKNNAPGGVRYILSNNHVLANSSLVGGPAAAVGDAIVQPGPIDGGASPGNDIATLSDFKPLDSVGVNDIDAAIAELIDAASVTPDILSIGNVGSGVAPPDKTPMPAALYQSVRKHGRTTNHTVGVIMDLSASIKVRYGTTLIDFDDQLAIVGAGGNFSAGGDSGSLIVDAVTLRPVGLLFAGGITTTFANPIDLVLGHFSVSIL